MADYFYSIGMLPDFYYGYHKCAGMDALFDALANEENQ